MINLGTLLLTGALALSGVNVTDGGMNCENDVDYLGGYVIGQNTIELCRDNIDNNKHSYATVLNHETLHLIHDRVGFHGSVIPEPLLTWGVRATMTDGQVMGVLLNYDSDEMAEEFSIRLLHYLPSDWIALALLMSNVVA